MKEATLRDVLLGVLPIESLASEAATATEQIGPATRRVHIQDLESDEEFEITAEMLIRLCDGVLGGSLPPSSLELIGFAVIASDHLGWAEDDELVARVLYDWACPEINWDLTLESVRMFRGWLTGEASPPPQPTLDPDGAPGQLVSRTTKVWDKPPAKPGEPNEA